VRGTPLRSAAIVFETEEKDWNQEFQSILDRKDTYEKYYDLASLAHDFVYAAKTYGKVSSAI